MKPKFNVSAVLNHDAGVSLVTAFTLCLSGNAFATTWSGGTSKDWNTNATIKGTSVFNTNNRVLVGMQAGNSVVVSQDLRDDGSTGSLAKAGAGTLFLNGANTYHGDTLITTGTLGGTGSIMGKVVVGAGVRLSPGVTTGKLTVGSATFAPTSLLSMDIAAAPDQLVVTGNLDLTNATLMLNGTPTAPVCIIATYGTLTGTFASTPVLPANYVIDYAYSGNQIAIRQTPYGSWINNYFAGVTDPNVVGPEADPDGDGSSNALEFALGGLPNNGGSGPKIYQFKADGSIDEDTDKELLMTIAVRSGTPVFSGTPSPSAFMDGYHYTIQGSDELFGFSVGVTPVGPVPPVAPEPLTAPTGYEYRTFSLDGSNSLSGKGFLRVKINP